MTLNQQEINHYQRHLLLPEVTRTGQEQLKTSKVLLIGAGGLGAPIAQYLAAAGVGQLTIYDGDEVEASNLHRQILYTYEDCGKNKAQVARTKLLANNPHINITAIPNHFNPEQVKEVAHHDVIIDGTDNFAARYLINDAAVHYGKPLVSAAIYRFDGQIGVYNHEDSACYRCVFPEPPAPGTTANCAEAGVLGVLPGFFGIMQATEAIKLILQLGTPMKNQLRSIDLLTMETIAIPIEKKETCPACSKPETALKNQQDYQETSCTATPPTVPLTKTIQDDTFLLDVRTQPEHLITAIPNTDAVIPVKELEANLHHIPKTKTITVYCKSGMRAAQATQILLDHGYQAQNLTGGILAYNELRGKLTY